MKTSTIDEKTTVPASNNELTPEELGRIAAGIASVGTEPLESDDTVPSQNSADV